MKINRKWHKPKAKPHQIDSSGPAYVVDRHRFREKLDKSQVGHVYGKGIEVYTDGGCRPTNPGPGTCGFVVIEDDNNVYEDVWSKDRTTNSEMEVNALLMALQFIVDNVTDEPVTIHTDSGYCHGTYTEYMHTWAKKGWKVNKSYLDEWKKMYELWEQLPNVKLLWVKGHSDNKWNSYIDKLISK